MKTETKQLTVSEQFIARRIAEFPTLYPHGDQVIYSCLVNTQGSCHWDENGLLKQDDQHYDQASKMFTEYPLRMPVEIAATLIHSDGKLLSPYYQVSGPINNIPVNVHDDWLMTLSIFLTKWGRYSMEDFELMATAHCLLHYGMRTNPNAGLPGRVIDDYRAFHKKIPTWKALVNSIYYQKQYNKIEPATYQGMDI